MNRQSLKPLILIAHLLFLIIYRLIGYSGHFGFDDMDYAQVSHQLMSGHFDSSNHFSFRWALTIPTAICYFLFGVNDFSSSLPPMLATSAILLIVYKILFNQSIRIISIGLSFTLLSTWFLFYSNKLMSDMYVSLAFLIVFYSYYRLCFANAKPIRQSIILVAGLFYGFLAKGTIILILPPLLFLFTSDLIQKRHFQFWKYSILIGLLAFIGYLTFNYIYYDDPLIRFSVIAKNGYNNHCSYSEQPLQYLLSRIGVDFWKMMRYDGLALIILISLLPLITRPFRISVEENKKLNFFSTISVLLLLSANFMTISFSSYNPMCMDIRHYLFLMPILGVASALSLAHCMDKTKSVIILTTLTLVLLLSYFFSQDHYLYTLYLPAAILFSFAIFFYRKAFFQPLFFIALTLILLIQPLISLKGGMDSKYEAQKDIIFEQLIDSKESRAIITDPVQARIGNYLLRFDTTSIQFFEFKELEKVTKLQKSHYSILINPYTLFFSRVDMNRLPLALSSALSEKAVFYDSSTNIKIFDLNSAENLMLNADTIVNTTLTFENDLSQAYWRANETELVSEGQLSGNFSQKVSEYSATFHFVIDSALIHDYENIGVVMQILTKSPEPTQSILVTSVDFEGKNQLWKGQPTAPFQNAFDNWFKVESQLSLETKDIKANTALTIYLWNKELKEIYLDDFQISVVAY